MIKKLFLYVLTITFVVSLLAYRIARSYNQSILKVKTSLAVRGDVKDYLSTTGVVKSKKCKQYYGLQSKVKKINVKLGDKVNIGDTLVVYDMPDYANEVDIAKIQYDNAMLSYKELMNQSENMDKRIAELDSKIYSIETMGEEGIREKLASLMNERVMLNPISKEKIKQAENSVNLAKVNLEEARKKYYAKKHLVVSDIKGVVTSVNAVEGTFPSSFQPMVTIEDINSLKAVVSIGKHEAERISEGKNAVIRDGDTVYNGKVSFIDPAAQKVASIAGENTFLEVEVDILSERPVLKVGFDYDVDILLQEVKNVIKVPIESVKTDKFGSSMVYIVENNKANERKVKLGLESDNEVQIISGLKVGEKLILNPGNLVKHGKKVRLSER